jgi:hypothetical protein
MKVRANATYRYNPVGMDVYDPPVGNPEPGCLLKVVNLYGCPKANTMGHCYVNFANTGKFAGMVLTNSLQKR